ncbi:MAG: protein kinase [Bacteroidaceae bacterium]|nr:protein kinase [Bacteroidaceae bacterium]
MPAPHDSSNLKPGTRLGAERQYLILEYIGGGGFGKTYLARNTKFGEHGPRLVIKEFFVRDHMHRLPGTSSVVVSNSTKLEDMRKFRAKFIREAQRIYTLNHPGIVRVTDIIYDENNTSYYVMDFVGSRSLSGLLRERGALPEAEAVRYTVQVLEALRVVHANRMLHLDVKPGNIMLNSSGQAVLIDFGASKVEQPQGNLSTTPMAYTRGFAPPEQVSGTLKYIDPRADIYAVGATLYNLLVAQRPPEPMDVLMKKEAAFVFPLSVSAGVRQAVLRMMSYSSADRPAAVDEALALLQPGSAEPDKVLEAVSVSDGDEDWYKDVFEVTPTDEKVLEGMWEEPEPIPAPTPVLSEKKEDVPSPSLVSSDPDPTEPESKPQPKPVKPAKKKRSFALSQKKWWIVGSVAVLAILVLAVVQISEAGSDVEATATDVEATATDASTTSYLSCPDSNHPHLIDLGLPSGTKWACCNVGAKAPQDYGGYYAWGETAEKNDYTWDTYQYGTEDNPTKYNNSDGKTTLEPSDDVAHLKWGGRWHMPTQEQCKELVEQCKYEWTSMNSVEGGKFTGPNGSSIFLPAAGSRYGSDLYRRGSNGDYWSSTLNPDNSNDANYLNFDYGSAYWYFWYNRYGGQSVRPVAE